MWSTGLKLIDWFVPESAKSELSELNLARNFVFTHFSRSHSLTAHKRVFVPKRSGSGVRLLDNDCLHLVVSHAPICFQVERQPLAYRVDLG